MKWSILTQNDLNTLRELGIKLKSGTKWEQTLGDLIVEYTNDRIPVPSKDEKSEKGKKIEKSEKGKKIEKSEKGKKIEKSEKGKPMFPDSESADEALAH